MTKRKRTLRELPPTYQNDLVRRLWGAQLSDASEEIKRLMAEAAQELEANLPTSDGFVAHMRKQHAKALRAKSRRKG